MQNKMFPILISRTGFQVTVRLPTTFAEPDLLSISRRSIAQDA